jgi:DNA polymerase III delta prime subunit
MSTPNVSTLDQAAEAGAVALTNYEKHPERVKEVADEPLPVPDPMAVIEAVSKGGFYDREAVEEAVIGLTIGHLLLGGPPGTGKTKIARLLAQAFDVELLEETANPEWSVYDVIGTQALTPEGGAVSRHGVVTNAIIQCANTITKSSDSGEKPFATWLLIDEFNRAEIDRAFGPLFTALSGDEAGAFTLDYIEGYPKLSIPARFRIIATMNDYDTRFVNTMSLALRRRFKRTLILPPANVDGRIPTGELEVALGIAVERLGNRLSGHNPKPLRKIVLDHEEILREVFGAVRSLGGHGGVPIGTAQIIDCCVYAMTMMAVLGKPKNEDSFMSILDRTLTAQLISGIESDSTRLRIDDTYVDEFSRKFPSLINTSGRLRRFLSGRE